MSKIKSHLLRLISSYTTNGITKDQFNDLQEWLNENPENKQTFSEYLRFYKKSRSISFREYLDKDKSWKEIVLKLERPLKIDDNKSESKVIFLKSFSRVFKYAAIAILFLGIGFLYQQGYFTNDLENTSPNQHITLQLENGNVEIINEDGSSKIVDAQGHVVGSQNGNQLVYTNKEAKETLEYNTLTVPYGKRFEIQLSDGTVVTLNAGTSLKYPVKFIKGKNRQVFLKGEAFFNVTKDKSHPFIVNANEIDVRVLGTQFNITSYLEDEYINTVLVEGSVSIYDKETTYNSEASTLLKPGFKAAWNKKENNIGIEEADIEIYTAWLQGKIIFKHIPFDNIVKKLERHYNVEIINNNASLGKDFITASFDVETIEQVFKVINEIHPIEYSIRDNKIIIN